MKLILHEHKSSGLTRIDVVVLTVLLVVLAMGVSFFVAVPRRQSRIDCVAILRQVGMALRVWEDDNGYSNTNSPWALLLETNVQTVGLNSGQIAWVNAMGITNFVRPASILQCSSDKETPTTTSATGLKIRISYFLNLDATEEYPQTILAGDDNLALGPSGSPAVTPGIQLLSSNTLISWTKRRHHFVGNVARY